MNLEEEYWELLEDYAAGKLDIKSQKNVEIWLSTNEDAQTTLIGIQTMMEQIPDEEDRNQYLQDQIEEVLRTNTTPPVKKSKNIRWHWPVAASIVAVASVTYLLFFSSASLEDKLNEHLSEPYAISNQVRAVSPSVENGWVASYKKGDYKSTIIQLEKTESIKGIERLYLALSYLYENQSNQAAELLETSFDNQYLDPQRVWYLSLAYLNQNQKQEAIPLLEQLVNAQSFKSEEAQELLKLIKE